ncbi:TIGR00730 family Rossman fold protein [Bifidobacterium ruminantium]|uniref:LOG family protein n=1 Tax=Bifidobacterium ruminantium TaxID=78346 RepID=UPI00195AE119|nr:TIGR00730 family Rossman fold protein [Bifidobacterium ruminantium]MBM6746696.1 TIGR00730 family Rossman fold protein [Bifidobacterium ruminantium]MBU9111029.1 TIGR00730 family Rossman fold protein [Bifidobacterium ruminantium]
MNITVYLGAHEGNDPSYKKAVEELGAWIADSGNRLVYGGSNEGLMANIADAVLSHGGKVTGIEAQMFADRGVAHAGLTELVIVPDITERRTRMIELGDAFIAFPGGTGTLEEISEVVSKICLGQLSQPCVFYNLNGFYNDMRAFLQRMVDAGFSTAERQQGIYFASNLAEIERIIANPRI